MKTNFPIKSKINEVNTTQVDQISAEPLWKRVNSIKIKQQDQQSQKSSQTMQRSQSQIIENLLVNTSVNQPNINQFFLKLHSKVNDSVSVSQSQIIQKLSLDWQEEQYQMISGAYFPKMIGTTQLNNSEIQVTRTQKNISNLLQQFKKIKSLEEFLKFIKNINTILFEEITKIINQNQQYRTQQFNNKNRQIKMSIKIKNLLTQLEVSQKKNIKLKEDFQRLRKEVDKQIKLQQDKNQHRFQKMIIEIKEDFEKKLVDAQRKMQTSTNFTNSTNLNEMKQTILKEEAWENKPRPESTNTPVKRKTGQLVRSNNSYRYVECKSARNGNCSKQNKETTQEKDKQIDRLKTLKQLIVRPVFKSLSLQNSSYV